MVFNRPANRFTPLAGTASRSLASSIWATQGGNTDADNTAPANPIDEPPVPTLIGDGTLPPTDFPAVTDGEEGTAEDDSWFHDPTDMEQEGDEYDEELLLEEPTEEGTPAELPAEATPLPAAVPGDTVMEEETGEQILWTGPLPPPPPRTEEMGPALVAAVGGDVPDTIDELQLIQEERRITLRELDATTDDLRNAGEDPLEGLSLAHLRALAASDDPKVNEEAARAVHIRRLRADRNRFLNRLLELQQREDACLPVSAPPSPRTLTPPSAPLLSAAAKANREGLAKVAGRKSTPVPPTATPAPTVQRRLLPALQSAYTPTPEEQAAADKVAEAIKEALTYTSLVESPSVVVGEGVTVQELELWRGANSSRQAKELREKYQKQLDEAEASFVNPTSAQPTTADVLARLRRETRMSNWFDRATITAAALKNACAERDCMDLYDLALEVVLEALEENERFMRALKAKSAELSRLNSQLQSSLAQVRAAYDAVIVAKDRQLQQQEVRHLQAQRDLRRYTNELQQLRAQVSRMVAAQMRNIVPPAVPSPPSGVVEQTAPSAVAPAPQEVPATSGQAALPPLPPPPPAVPAASPAPAPAKHLRPKIRPYGGDEVGQTVEDFLSEVRNESELNDVPAEKMVGYAVQSLKGNIHSTVRSYVDTWRAEHDGRPMPFRHFETYMRERFYDAGVVQRLMDRMRPYAMRQHVGETTPDFHSRFLMALNQLGAKAPEPSTQADLFISNLRNEQLSNFFTARHRGKPWQNLHEAYTAVHEAVTADPTKYQEPDRPSARYPYSSTDKRKGTATPASLKKQRTQQQRPQQIQRQQTPVQPHGGQPAPRHSAPTLCSYCGHTNHKDAQCGHKHKSAADLAALRAQNAANRAQARTQRQQGRGQGRGTRPPRGRGRGRTPPSNGQQGN